MRTSVYLLSWIFAVIVEDMDRGRRSTLFRLQLEVLVRLAPRTALMVSIAAGSQLKVCRESKVATMGGEEPC